jgi:phosphopantothenoylcysteine synthetase/decarboxylase
MKFHHQFIESKLEMRQVQTIQTNIVMIYAFVDILKDHFFMSTLFLLSNETLNSRSTRKERFASRQENDENSSSNDEKNSDENDEDDENDENDETQTKRQNEDETNRIVENESFESFEKKKVELTNVSKNDVVE